MRNGENRQENAFKKWIESDFRMKKLLNGLALNPKTTAEIDEMIERGFAVRYFNHFPDDVTPSEFLALRDFYVKVWEKARTPKEIGKTNLIFLRALIAAIIDDNCRKFRRRTKSGITFELKYLPPETAWITAEIGFQLGMAYNELKFRKPKSKKRTS